jgi:hypothetical protein
MIKWTRQHTYIVIGVVLSSIVIYAICFFTIIKPLQIEENAVEQQLDMFERRYETITNQSKKEEIDEDLADVMVKVPMDKSPDNVLANLQTLAADADVEITSISSSSNEMDTENKEEESQVNRAIYSLEVVGDNIDVVNVFLDSVLESDRLMVIDTLSLFQDDQSVSVSLTITTFYSEKSSENAG